VAGALIQEGLALLRDESFDLDLIGFDVTEMERLLALADSEAGQTTPRTDSRAGRESGHKCQRPLAPGHPPAAVR
jgi:hypothetical protein